ncbi:MAG: MFS transporter [Gemmatimonadota bacterium]
MRPEEIRALLWSCAYFFCILSAYYILRPLREEMGIAGGVRNLPWLFTGTLVAMLLLHPPFAALVSRLPRLRFVSITYRFFMLNLLIFFVLLKLSTEAQNIWVGRAFFVWISVFNLFIVSVFWAFMADTYNIRQGKRLFGFIGVGGSLGGILGSAITATLAGPVGPVNLLLISVVLLELGVLAVRRLARISDAWGAPPALAAAVGSAGANGDAGDSAAAAGGDREEPIGGSFLAGITHVMRSPYLLGIVAYMLLYTITATFLYFQQAEIVAATFDDRAVRTSFFARLDLLVNILTVGTQLFLTGRIIKLLGVAVTLAILPIMVMIGFTGLGLMPTLAVLATIQVLRRSTNFAVARPTRETLYTVLPREDKYKAKNFIDTFVYRSGDQIGAWSYALMGWLGLTMVGIAFATVPLAGVWLLVAFWLGRRQTELASEASSAEELPAASAPA